MVAALQASTVDHDALLVLGLVAVVATAVLLRRSPRLAFLSYLVVLAGVPVWVGVTVGVHFYLEPQVLWALVVLASLIGGWARRARWIAADALFAVFVVASIAPLVTGGATSTTVFNVLVPWLGAYLVGRLLPPRAGYEWCLKAIAVVFTVVAVLALLEFATRTNFFVAIPGNAYQYSAWGSIQMRGGVPRAEGAFGHSIALGAALAMAVPFTLGSRFRLWLRLGMVAVMVAAIAVTFSRIGIVTAALGIGLSLLFFGREMSLRLRVLLSTTVALVGAVLYPTVSGVFSAAGPEATTSVDYRVSLLSLIGDMRILGLSPAFHRSPTGTVTFGSFRSIDSALLLQGLTYGWFSLVVVLLLLVLSILAVVTGRATAPTIALVAQIPAFATVALITQYSTMVFFVGGLAVFATAARGGAVTAPRSWRPAATPFSRLGPPERALP